MSDARRLLWPRPRTPLALTRRRTFDSHRAEWTYSDYIGVPVQQLRLRGPTQGLPVLHRNDVGSVSDSRALQNYHWTVIKAEDVVAAELFRAHVGGGWLQALNLFDSSRVVLSPRIIPSKAADVREVLRQTGAALGAAGERESP